MKKSIMCFLLAVVMVMSMATGVMAADEDQGLSLKLTYSEEGVILEAYLTAEGLTNGRIVANYDASKVTLAGVEAGDDSWLTSFNTKTEGEVSFAWAGSKLGAEETLMFTLTFTEVSEGSNVGAVYSAVVAESFNSGSAVEVGSSSDEVVGEEETEIPSTPSVPSVPSGPSEPEEQVNPFIDIDDSWAKEDILTAYYAGLIKGTSENTYSPELNVTRAMFVTLLYRLEGEPAVSGETPFTDLAEGEYYVDAVAWAYENGVVNGTSDSTYSPNAVITREQMVTMLYRYAKYDGRDVAVSDDLDSFSDAGSVSDWALDAVKWAVADGIIQGYDGVLSPQGSATREQMAAIFVRYAGL